MALSGFHPKSWDGSTFSCSHIPCRRDGPGVDSGRHIVLGGDPLLSPHHLSRISWLLLWGFSWIGEHININLIKINTDNTINKGKILQTKFCSPCFSFATLSAVGVVPMCLCARWATQSKRVQFWTKATIFPEKPVGHLAKEAKRCWYVLQKSFISKPIWWKWGHKSCSKSSQESLFWLEIRPRKLLDLSLRKQGLFGW